MIWIVVDVKVIKIALRTFGTKHTCEETGHSVLMLVSKVTESIDADSVTIVTD